MNKRIVMLCSLDTKAPETEFLQTCIEQQGLNTTLVDIGYGQVATMPADISADAVAREADSSLQAVLAMQDTSMASDTMIRGAARLLGKLIEQERCDAVLAFGGASNSSLASSVMQSLPLGIPKLIISSAAGLPAYAAKYFGNKDITMMHSIVDLSGLNDITRAILHQGASAICGMAANSQGQLAARRSGRLVAVTTFRFAETCSQLVMSKLQEAGYSAIPFHAQGVGENTMEDMIAEGVFAGVIDLVPAGLSEQLLGGNRAARADRLEAAGRAGIPMVMSTSGFDMISCGPIERKDSTDTLWQQRSLAQRQLSIPDRHRVEARTSAEEVTQIASLLASKLNQYTSPASVLVPRKGWSSLSTAGEDLYNPQADAVFVPSLRQTLNAAIGLKEIDEQLNSERYAQALVLELLELINSQVNTTTNGN